jgi:hypothetical protein
LTASANYKQKVGGPETHAKTIIHQDAVKSAVKALRSKTAQQIYIIGNCQFLAKSQILNCTNKASFRKELSLQNLGWKKLDTSESSFTKRLVFQLQKCADAKRRHVVTVTTCALLSFTPVHLVKVSSRKFE